ncbi:MAG TPA: hypothetical protein DD413_02075 [Ruminococcus sp.]|nr:hypothetical protein [Ruminococcus sp.]
MSDNMEKDRLRELEIESILEETHYLADQEKMELTAKKYRAKPKMTEIFSNADKKPRLTNDNPLDVDVEYAEIVADTTKTIVGEKNAATMQAALLMDGSDEEVLTPREAQIAAEQKSKENAKKSAEDTEIQSLPDEKEDKLVTLAPEYGDDTEFSSEVIGEVEQFEEPRGSIIQDLNGIDIDLPDDNEKAEQTEEEHKQTESEVTSVTDVPTSEHSSQTVVSKVPMYKPDRANGIINVKAGKFSDVVAREYEEYIKSKNPSVITHVIKPEPKEEKEEEEKESKPPITERMLAAVVGLFSRDESDDVDTPKEKNNTVEDYTNEEDARSIRLELNHNIKKLFVRSMLTGIIAAISVVLTVITRIFPESICSAVAFAPAAYAVFNFILVGFSIFINRISVASGLTPLVHFKGNSDTPVAVGAVTAVLQIIISFFCLGDLQGFYVNYYCVAVLLAFFANNCGKLFMVLRVKDNFKFITSNGQKYAAKIYNNETVANQMMSGTAADKNIIAYHHKTSFPANFLKISYAPDPSEDLASKLAPVTTLAGFLIAIMYGFANASFTGAFNAFALITAVAIPVSTLLAVNVPVRRLCKTLLTYDSMLAGYPSVKQFCDSTGIMLDATELFPADCIELEGIKTFEDYAIDESLLCGIAVLKEAGNPIANAFDSVVAETKETLPEVESVLYEDEIGLVGWINSERILVGSRRLLEKYNVETPSNEYEDKYTSKGRQITYLAKAGRLVAMFVTNYNADSELKLELQRAEANGISILIRTTDFNVTNDLVAQKYNLFYRSIKVLPTGLGNVLKEAESTVEETSRSYLITSGRLASMARAISGCVKIKHNISLAIIIQLISIILGVLVCATLSLYAGVGVIGSLELLIYTLFWGAAAVIAPALQKP